MEKTFGLWDKEQKVAIEVTAKKVGIQWQATCPKHDDTHPSLSINTEKKVFHCFGCGWSGKLLTDSDIPEDKRNCSEEIEAIYDYTDEEGNLSYQVIRNKGKKFFQRRPDGQGGWIYNLSGVRKVLYNLPEITSESRRNEIIFIVEGEKDVDNLASLGLLATTNSGGAGKWLNDSNKYFTDREVVVIPDNDEQGKNHANTVAKSVSTCARYAKILNLPDTPEKGDVSDWIEAGGSRGRLLALAKQAIEYGKSLIDDTPPAEGNCNTSNYTGSSAAQLINCISNAPHLTFFFDETKELWATIDRYSHREYHAINSQNFADECRRLYMGANGRVIGSESLKIALENMRAGLQGRGGLLGKKTYLRIGGDENTIFYDLADPTWQVIKVDKEGWRVINDSPIIFKRFPHMQQQAIPVKGDIGAIKEILRFVNVEAEDSKILIEVWLVSLFIPEIAHPVLVLYGSQGSGKTFFSKLVKNLCDPSICEVLSLGNNTNEIIQSLSHHYFNPFDNLSGIPKDVSDLLCRAVTGEGFSKRKLYTDDEDIIYTYKRAIALNGINNVVSRPDLLDRSILVECQRISEGKAKQENKLLHEFNTSKSEILGGIFTTIAEVLRQYNPDFFEEESLPRMADFYCYGYMIAEILGIGGKRFRDAYNENIASQDKEVIAGNSVASTLMQFMEAREEWEGTASGLLSALGEIAEANKIDKRFADWPKTPQHLSKTLNISKVNFEKFGIIIDHGHWKGNEKIIRIFNDGLKKENDRLKQERAVDAEKLAKLSEEFRESPEPGWDDSE